MDWHDEACTHFDKAHVANFITCLSCGSCTEFDEGKDTHTIKNMRCTYSPIKQRTELRILRLYPGALNDPVRCDLLTQNISDADYEAISYTWADESGDKSKCESIFIDVAPSLFTRNCEMALKRVRKTFSHRYVWVDAVCIDQTNTDERGHQVQLMPQIYSKAKSVLIYVGESSNDSSFLLHNILNGQIPDADAASFNASLCHFSSRKYFSRVWVLQEIALARRSPLICGDVSILWQLLQPKRLLSLHYLEKVDSLPNGTRLPAALYFDDRIYTQADQLISVLDFASNCLAEDPRDKVYSLLGLAPGPQSQGLETDYNLTVEEVYIKTAITLGRHFGWGLILDHAVSRNPQIPNLPSWVPDWSVGRSKLSFFSTIQWPKPRTVNPEAISFEFLYRVKLGSHSQRMLGDFASDSTLHLFDMEGFPPKQSLCLTSESPLCSYLRKILPNLKYSTVKISMARLSLNGARHKPLDTASNFYDDLHPTLYYNQTSYVLD